MCLRDLITDLLISGEQGLREWNRREDFGGYGEGRGQVRTLQDSLARHEPSRRKDWSGSGVQRRHAGLFISSPGVPGARAVGTC